MLARAGPLPRPMGCDRRRPRRGAAASPAAPVVPCPPAAPQHAGTGRPHRRRRGSRRRPGRAVMDQEGRLDRMQTAMAEARATSRSGGPRQSHGEDGQLRAADTQAAARVALCPTAAATSSPMASPAWQRTARTSCGRSSTENASRPEPSASNRRSPRSVSADRSMVLPSPRSRAPAWSPQRIPLSSSAGSAPPDGLFLRLEAVRHPL